MSASPESRHSISRSGHPGGVAILRSETDRWGKLVRTAGLKAE